MKAPRSDPARADHPLAAGHSRVAARARLHGTLALLWCFPSAGALWLLAHDPQWLRAGGVRAALLTVRLEQWVAVGLLALHGWFFWRWRRLARAA
jgi:hypothetical protein